jgi:VCBS repeat-containing protein
VTPGVVNHIKIAIADVGDGLYDSNVFIQQSSFVSGNAPVAVNESYNVSASTPRVVAAAQGVLINDSDLDNNLQSAQLITSPAHGTVTLNADGSFTYTPTNGYTGADSFTYQAVDTTFIQSNVGIVSLTVIAGPLAPSITTPTSASITSTTATLGGNVTGNGGAVITALGVVYSKTSLNASPQIGGANVTNLSGTVSNTFPYPFTVNASVLTASTGYSYAAYATNSVGTTYTTFGTFTTSAPPSTTITSLNRLNTTPSNASTVNWTLTFAAANTGVTASNFSLGGAAASGASVGTPTTADGGINWNVPVTTGSTDGTLTLSLANATGTTPGVSTSLPFAGQSYTMDLTLPTVTIGSPSPSSVSPGGSVTYSVTYADTNFASSSLTSGGITLNTTGGASGTVGVTGSGTTYTVTISGVTGAGTIGISVAAGTALDAAGNANLASSASTTFTVIPPPTIASLSSTTANGSYNATTLIPLTVTFSAAVTVTGTPTLALNSGGSASYASGSGTSTLTFNYTVGATDNATDLDCSSTTALSLAGGTISATTGGTAATLTLPTPGAANSLGANKALVIDTTPPTILSINRLTPSGQTTGTNTVTFRVTYSETVTVPGTSNFSVVAVNGSNIVGTVTGVTGSGTTRDVTVTINSGTGEFRLRGVN